MILHPGIPKSATSLIQASFSSCEGIYCIGRPNHRREEYQSLKWLILNAEEWDRNKAKSILKREESLAKGQIAVLSDEKLMYAPLLNIVAQRLHEIAPQTHVVLTVRNQLDIVRSIYTGGGYQLKGVPKPYLGKHVSFNDWFDWMVRNEPIWRMLDFAEVYRIYSRHFQVSVLFYEDIKSDRAAYEDHWSRILGTDFQLQDTKVNPAKTSRAIAYHALRPKMLEGVSLSSLPGGALASAAFRSFLARGRAVTATLNAGQTELVRLRCAGANRHLAKLTNRNLSDLGYPV